MKMIHETSQTRNIPFAGLEQLTSLNVAEDF